MRGQETGKDRKNEMYRASQERNAALVKTNQELREAFAGAIAQRDEALELARVRGEALAAAEQKLKDFENQGLRVQVRKVTEEKPPKVHIKTVPRHETPAEPQDRRPFGIRVQSAIAEFLKDWGRAPRDPQRIAWDRAYHINGALLNGELRFTLDEIMAAVGWIQYTLGEQGHSIEETREYLGRELPNLGRRGECELAFLDLAFPPEQQRANVREAEAVPA